MNNANEIDFFCPYCTQKLNGPADLAGQIVNCPVCNKRFQIPASITKPTVSQSFPSFITPLKGEKVLSVIRPSGLYFLGSYLLGSISLLIGVIFTIVGFKTESPILAFGLIATVFALPYMLWTIVNMHICLHSYLYVMTNLRVVAKTGFVSIATNEVRIVDIRGVNLRQGILGRMVDVGSIAIGSAATAGTEISIVGIQNPRQILALINSQRKS